MGQEPAAASESRNRSFYTRVTVAGLLLLALVGLLVIISDSPAGIEFLVLGPLFAGLV